MKEGDKVRYIPFDGSDPINWEKGIIKRISEEGNIFVVYHCNDDWNNYQQYTGQNTPIKRLVLGWE